jgi:hypothetical protein
MATVTSGYNFTNGETVTPAKLNSLAGSATVSGIVNADIDAAAAIADSKLATISTAGKVSNTATTATSSNTASALVTRDSSGNFSAGTIAANLTGNVTGNVTGNATGLSSPASGGLAKAWVAYDPTLAPLTGTGFTPGAGQLINATKSGHGLNTGDSVTLFSQTGNNAVLNGSWSITRVDNNTFTFTITGTNAASYSNATIYPIRIYSAYNVRTVGPTATNTSGSHQVTFTTAFATATYAALVTPGSLTTQSTWPVGRADNITASGFQARTVYYSGGTPTAGDYSYTSAVVFSL